MQIKIKNPVYGVPISVLDYHNYTIIGLAVYPAPLIDNNKKYSRILIKRNNVDKT